MECEGFWEPFDPFVRLLNQHWRRDVSNIDYFRQKRLPPRDAVVPRAPVESEEAPPRPVLGAVLRVITIGNAVLLATAVVMILVGALGEASPAEANSLGLPPFFLSAWIYVLPVTVALGLLLNRAIRWQWARDVNCTLGALWAASLALLWSSGLVPGL